ncbi:metallophosphoesterase [Streptomyces sp. NPDC089799]|uniref:metallophosphoesterase n=1 Tax=Streptomyces sp. NPDC089799 TaxID=3155066 RepID=UPI003434C983
MALIAHLSDIHLDTADGGRSAARTRAVMDYLEGLPVDLDAVLVTGDIADHGRPDEYASARELLLGSRHPVLVCPGNHDDRTAFRTGLLGLPGSVEPVNQVLRTAGCTIALCDSSVPGEDEGFLSDGTLAWLEEVLAGTPAGTPVLVGFHHPPVELHTPYVDQWRQFGEERLAALARRYPDLAGFLCGHTHTATATVFAGRPLLVAPGVVSALRLPWEQPTGPSPHVHLDLPPAVAFHVVDGGGRLTTHYRIVDASSGLGSGR